MRNKSEFPCFEKYLEVFLRYWNQIPAYRSFSKTLDVETPSKFSKHPYFQNARRLADEFETAEEIADLGKEHIPTCPHCSPCFKEIKRKYEEMSPDDINKLTPQEKNNLKYYGIKIV